MNESIVEGIVAGLAAGGLLTTIGGLFVWLALKVPPNRGFSIYGAGMFVKTIVGIAICVAAVLLTSLHLISFMLTMGSVVCVSYPLTAIIMTSRQKDLYKPVSGL